MKTIALFAGRGELPQRILHHCIDTSHSLFLIAFEGQTDPEFVSHHQPMISGHLWTHFGAVGEILKYLKAHSVTHIVMAGAMNRPSWSEIKLDWKGTQWLAKMGLAKLGKTQEGDDGLLSHIVSLLNEEGFEVLSPVDLLPSLQAPKGVMGEHTPNEEDWQDIQRGKEVVNLLGAGDIGQSAVIQEGLVLGVEAIEGTQELLKRCTTLRRSGRGGVLVKMSKPNQTQSVDLPTIGIDTISQAKEAGLRGIALESGLTQILDKDAVIAAANAAGLYIVGIERK